MAQRIKSVNEKFRVRRLLEKSNVRDGDGVSVKRLTSEAIKDFKPQMHGVDYTDAKGRVLETPTVDLLKTLKVTKAFKDKLPNSGTPTGLKFADGFAEGLRKSLMSQAGQEMYYGSALRGGASLLRTAADVIPGFGR